MALVVNGDDFGMDEGVNRAITQAFERGLIDRTTLMANMPGAQDAMKIAKERGFIDRVGIHINLTSGVPLTKKMRTDRVMCGEDGRFSGDFARSLRTRFFLPKETENHLESELRAQLDMYRSLGGTLWHIDSHHHVHTDPSVYRVLRKVIRDYPVTSVRLTRNMFRGGNPLMRIYKTFFNMSVRRLCDGDPRYFGSAQDYEEYIKYRPDIAKDHEVEVMVHPVYDSAQNLCDISHGVYRKLERLH